MDSARQRKTITSVFTLALKSGPLGGLARAEFRGPEHPVVSGDTRTFAMTITIGDRAAGAAPGELAQILYHEGTHMQLYVDRAAPGWARSTFFAPF